MRQFLGFGNGQDGDKVVSASADYDGANAGCSGTSGTKSLTLDAASVFSNGDIVLIHQSRGSGAGNWELNQIASGAGTTSLTLVHNLDNTYSDSGADQAQIVEVQQYKSITINASQNWTAPAWDGNKGGILAALCSGKVNNNGIAHADSRGFRGGSHLTSSGVAFQGEGTGGAGSQSNSANGNGGGGGGGGASGGSGGSGGNGTAGTAGNGGNHGAAGNTAGSSDGSTIVFGGAGGAGGCASASSDRGGDGGKSGGIIMIWAAGGIANSQNITASGGNGGNVTSSDGSGGAPGAGGTVYIVTRSGSSLGSNTITALGSTVGGNQDGFGSVGPSSSGNGRIIIKSCSISSGTTNPSASVTEGGHNFCGSGTINM